MDSQVDGKNPNDELAEALKTQNYTRAAWIAKLMKRPEEEIRSLQQKALKQYIVEYRNAKGVQTLLEEFQFSDMELERLVQSLLQEIRNEEAVSGKNVAEKQFDIETMRSLTLDEWIEIRFRSVVICRPQSSKRLKR